MQRLLGWIAALALCTVPAVRAQSLGFMGFTPWVLNASQPPAQFLFSAALSGTFTRVEFVLDPIRLSSLFPGQ